MVKNTIFVIKLSININIFNLLVNIILKMIKSSVKIKSFFKTILWYILVLCKGIHQVVSPIFKF